MIDIPECCYNCQYFDTDYSEMRDETYYFCLVNLHFPTKNRTCKRCKPYNHRHSPDGEKQRYRTELHCNQQIAKIPH